MTDGEKHDETYSRAVPVGTYSCNIWLEQSRVENALVMVGQQQKD